MYVFPSNFGARPGSGTEIPYYGSRILQIILDPIGSWSATLDCNLCAQLCEVRVWRCWDRARSHGGWTRTVRRGENSVSTSLKMHAPDFLRTNCPSWAGDTFVWYTFPTKRRHEICLFIEITAKDPFLRNKCCQLKTPKVPIKMPTDNLIFY